MSLFLDITLMFMALLSIGVVAFPRPSGRTFVDQMMLVVIIFILMLLNRLMVIARLLERMVER